MPPTFLVNCYGMAWEEVTASSIIEIDLEGNIIDPGDQELPRVQAAAFAIHGAVHMAHMDSGAAQCVMHTHEAYVTALSSLKCGLLPLTQTALIAGPVAYHPYGPPLSENECESMVENMGDALVLVMENHVSSVLPPSS